MIKRLSPIVIFVLLGYINNSWAYVNVTESPKGIQELAPTGSLLSPTFISDGSIGNNWQSRLQTTINTFEFTYDDLLDGITGENGDANDIYQLRSLSLYLPGSSESLKEFTLQVQNNGGSWQTIFSPQAITNPYNFAQTSTGGIRAVQPGSSFGSSFRINDGVIGGGDDNWISAHGVHNNIFEFVFDPDLNGTSAELSDHFTLDSVTLNLPGNSRSLKKFQLFVQSNSGAWQRLYSPQAITQPYNFAQTSAGAIRAVEPSASFGTSFRINDGVIGGGDHNWISAHGVHNNIFEFVFDPDLNGTSAELSDQFTLDSVTINAPGSARSLKEFQLFAQSNSGTWQRLYSPQAITQPYNFAQTSAGAIRAVEPSASFGSSFRINDGVIGGGDHNWISAHGVHNNIFEFVFDPDLNGTSAELSDQFSLDSVTINLPGNARSLKAFEITVKTTAGWQAPIALQASNVTGDQSFAIGPYNNVIRIRLQTISNYGQTSWLQINEFKANGVWNGLNPSFKASQVAGDQVFDLSAIAINNDGRRDNITRLKLQTINNYGQTSWLQINEFKANGVWNGLNPNFKASQIAGDQVFDLSTIAINNDGRRDNITRLKLQTINSYGHTSWLQINEFKANGVWVGDNPIFKTTQTSAEQSFDLSTLARNNDGRRDGVTRLRFKTLTNYGASYLRVNEFQAFGILTGQLPEEFNAFDSATVALATKGPLQTRIANNGAISFDVVALTTDKTAVDVSFTHNVKVELLANMSSVALDSDNCPVTSTVISTLAATTISGGRSTVSMPIASNVWKNVYVRISYQAPAGTLVIACALDPFSIRPAAFTLVAQHSNWETAGSSHQLSATSSSASPIHKAGRLFTLQLKAVDSAGTTMTNYADLPTIDSSYPALMAPAGGILGSLNLGTLTNSNGVITSNTANYSEVGAISLKISDENFSNVDAADGTTLTNRTVSSPVIQIGRFVPDHFQLSATTNGTFDNSCTGFSYIGQLFTYLTKPTLTVTAYNSSNAITKNYTNNFAKLTATDFSITAPTSDAIKLGADGLNLIILIWNPAATSLTDNANGSFTFTFGTDSYNHQRNSHSLVSPFANTVNLIFTDITDGDGVTTQALPHTLQVTGGSIRFGRINISNAHGSELIPLPIAITTEYFNGVDWTNNAADQCTVLTTSHLQVSNPETAGGWLPSNAVMTIANGTTTGTLSNNSPLTNGTAQLLFSAPGEDNHGYINIKSRMLGSYNWLLGDYDNDGIYDDEASARASFGLFRGSDTIIFRREVY